MSEKRFELVLPNAVINDTIARKSFYLSEKEDVEKIVGVLNQLHQENEHLIIGNKNLMKKNEQLKKEKGQLFRDLLETQGSYVRLVCFVRRLGLKGDDLAKFKEEIGVDDE